MICQKRASNGTTLSRSYFARGFKAGTPTYFHTRDHLGSVWEVVGSNGSTIESRVRYSPWGEMSNVSGSGAKADFAFAGHYSDAPNSLALAQYRGYSGVRGRWLNRDPSGEVDGPNRYAYVLNNPAIWTDPDGLRIVPPGRVPDPLPTGGQCRAPDPKKNKCKVLYFHRCVAPGRSKNYTQGCADTLDSQGLLDPGQVVLFGSCINEQLVCVVCPKEP